MMENLRIIKHVAVAAALLGAGALLGCGGDTKKPTGPGAGGEPVPKPSDTVVVDDQHAVYGPLEVGADHASWPKLNKEPVMSKTHGGRFVDTYVNEIGREAYKDDDAEIPVGTVIVKTSWETVDGAATEVAGPIFVMERRAGEGGEPTWWYALHWEKVPEKWQKAMGGEQAYWRTPSSKVDYCSGCHDNFPRELGNIPKEARSW
jgi:hypothetical protein